MKDVDWLMRLLPVSLLLGYSVVKKGTYLLLMKYSIHYLPSFSTEPIGRKDL